MLQKKRKISRKEIKEDKLVTSYYNTLGYFEENKNRIFLWGGALVVLIIAIFGYISYRSGQNEEAGLHLSRVMTSYDTGNYLEAIEGVPAQNKLGLKSIVNEYGSTESGEIAKVFLANSYFMLGKTEEAFEYYDDYDGDNDIFEASALAGQGGYYESKNDFEKAADLYAKASKVSEENILNPEYMLKAAANYIKAGEDDTAKNLLEKIKKDHNTSAAFRDVDRYLAQID